jgi:uncharacterized protein (DUF1684 family)
LFKERKPVKRLTKLATSGFIALLAFRCFGLNPTSSQTYEEKILQMRRDEAKALTAPGGWLALVALQPLAQGAITVGSAEGSTLRLEHGIPHAFKLTMKGNTVTITDSDPTVTVAGKRAASGQVIPEEAPIQWSGLTATVIRRTGGRTFLRVWDPRSPNLLAFHKLKFYPIDPKFRIVAKWIPYSPNHQLHMGTVTGDILTLPSPGYAEFTVGGQVIRLEPYEGQSETLAFLFRDGTGSTTTYGAGRELQADRPSNGLKAPGTVVLDFNTAFNPPCAYTQFGTCPLAPRQNRFAENIPAGEKRYHD